MMWFKKYKEHYRLNLTLAIPVVLSQVGQVTVQILDNAMVGRLGALPLTCVAFGSTVFFLVFILVNGLTMGLTPLVGEQYSKGRYRNAAAYFQNSLVLYPTTGIIAFAVSQAIVPLMYRMGQPVEVVDNSLAYYGYVTLSIVPFMVFASFKQFLEGVGNTVANMVIIITANIINIFLNWVLIYGNLGFAPMGASGAGLATLISRICMPFFACTYFYWNPALRRYFKYFKKEVFASRWNRDLLRIGFPIATQMFLEGSAFALTALMVGWIGMNEIAANQIALTVSNFAFMVVVGLGAATTIRVSHELGRGSLKRMKMAANASYHITLAWNTFTAVLFIVFRYRIPALFTHDPEVIEIASGLMIFAAAFQFSDGVQCISVGILRGLQDVRTVMYIALFSYIIINLPVGYLCAFVFGWGAAGLWVGFIFGLSVAALLLTLRFGDKYRMLRRAGRSGRLFAD
ncbi:MAG: MATE family efflux transporter [Rikenellaceae bacterium]|nr:MATE family efflux transporter [Rikenellaceae bacterium]